MARLVWCSNQLAKQSSFVRISISRFTWITRSLIHFSKQRGPNKRQACRIKKVLSLVLFFFLLLTLLYNVTFGQILIQFLMKNLAIKILIMFSCWNINKTINFLWSYESSLSIRVNSHFLQVWLAWNFCVLHHGPTRVEELIFGGTYVFLDHFNC